MIIRIKNKEEFSRLLNKGKGNKKLYDKLWSYNDADDNLPSKFPQTALKNDLEKDRIRIELLTGIIYLILKDNNPNEVGFKYTIQDFQKIFTHFNKSDLNIYKDDYFEKYNHLLEELTTKHPFEKLSLNENWEIEGDNCTSIEGYKNKTDAVNEELKVETSSNNILVFIALGVIIISAFIFYINTQRNNSRQKTETQNTELKSKSIDSVINNNELIKTPANIKSLDSVKNTKMNIIIHNSDSAKVQINNFENANINELNL